MGGDGRGGMGGEGRGEGRGGRGEDEGNELQVTTRYVPASMPSSHTTLQHTHNHRTGSS